jgi:hypothetical protein
VVNTPDDLAVLSANERANLNLAPNAFDKGDLDKFVPAAKN